MGRKKKYKTNKDKHGAQLQWQREHYKRNKDKILQKARETYQKKKLEKVKKEQRKRLYGE